MKHPKLLGPMALALFLVLNNSCGKDDPCKETTFYLDNDGDGEGDSAKPQMACEKPDKHVANANDPDDTNANIFSSCTKVTYYLDNDGDTFGNPDQSMELCDGVTAPDKYVTDNTDCNDTDSDIHPSAQDTPNDGVDSDCDGTYESIIWTGPNKVFSKDKNDDWTDPQYQDMITEKVTFTRQDNDYLFNLTWWEDNIGNAPVHGQDASDLAWEFWGPPVNSVSNITGHNPTGGTKGVRWTLLDIDTPNTASWNNFQFYGTLGDNTHFYSLNNIATMARNMNYSPLNNVTDIINDFTIEVNSQSENQQAHMAELVGRTLGVWLVEEDIYFTLKFTEWTTAANGGTITYERSTPITL
ncbi:putative metal-binding motif-containing protein [Flagellimonas olearia]|uniref:Uncharacterized protein n=1 Tax=Flagellimonas olearia TaxID=552546 RepID=A0A444VQ27_9FLAO|nr:putative metal-binding motif-containing protein [Allomuricauda olearia]RYC52792.1 hypothetical protein DN53_00815 [Allomuricauda olearia]